jgi:hypothetical protein
MCLTVLYYLISVLENVEGTSDKNVQSVTRSKTKRNLSHEEARMDAMHMELLGNVLLERLLLRTRGKSRIYGKNRFE